MESRDDFPVRRRVQESPGAYIGHHILRRPDKTDEVLEIRHRRIELVAIAGVVQHEAFPSRLGEDPTRKADHEGEGYNQELNIQSIPHLHPRLCLYSD